MRPPSGRLAARVRRRRAPDDRRRRLAAAVGPDTVEVGPRHLRLGGQGCASFAVVGYPREVGLGWLEPLLADPGRLEVSLHIDPVPPAIAAERLRRQLSRLEAGRRVDADRGRLVDPLVEAAAEDAHDLAARLARGEGKLFRVGLYLTVHAADAQALDAESARVRTLAASLLLDARPASWRTLQGWVTTLPLGVDALRIRRAFDTQALAAGFPFTSPDLTAPLGATAVLYGTNTASASLVMWDRFTQDNHNSVILARSGSGKSYLAKIEALRALYTGVEVAIIDPENEYARLAHAVGGAYLHLGAPGVRVNPFDLPTGGAATADALTRRALFGHTIVGVLLGQPPDPAGRAALDRAIVAAYTTVGITADPRSWARPAPLLRHVTDALASDTDPAGHQLAARLAPYVTGSHRGLFDGPTTTRADGHLVVFSLRDLPDELKPVGTLLTLDAIWRRVSDPARRRPRLVVVDEAWLLMRDPDGARFLYRMAKAARKHWAGLTVITQDAADLLGSDLGQAVVANATTQILLRQAPQAIERIGDAFGLSAGERQLLLAADRGEGLLVAGDQRVGFRVIASPDEHRLATTDPAELADLTADDPAGVGDPL
jgi:type IV secretory pathway VirB4 component